MTNHSKGTMVVLGTDLAARSLRAAHDAGTSRSELIRRLLADYLEENGAA